MLSTGISEHVASQTVEVSVVSCLYLAQCLEVMYVCTYICVCVIICHNLLLCVIICSKLDVSIAYCLLMTLLLTKSLASAEMLVYTADCVVKSFALVFLCLTQFQSNFNSFL